MARETTGPVAMMIWLASAGCGDGGAGGTAPTGPEQPSPAGPAQPTPPAPNTLTPREQAEGWRLLFDGRTTAGWRGFRSDVMPTGWQVIDGALTRVAPGGDIVTVDEFDDFELTFDWQIAPGGNSGVFFRVTEDAPATYESGAEYQLLDNAGHPDGAVPETSAGANYGLHAPSRAAARPPGEWNEARIVARGNHVEHWLNGNKIVEYELGSPDWLARVQRTKFASWPGYGRSPRGRIALQDHGDRVSYRNVKLRPLGDTPR